MDDSHLEKRAVNSLHISIAYLYFLSKRRAVFYQLMKPIVAMFTII